MTTSDWYRLLPNAYHAFFSRFPRLRPAQEQVIPRVLAGYNVLLSSPTGSGKTEAIVAPVCEQALARQGELHCLYICPTRALVNDIERRVEVPMRRLGLRVGVRHGDRKTLRGKTVPAVLVTTPESLDVMLGSHDEAERDRLRGVRVVVIDEVHQFYQTHRGYQLVLLLERLKRLTRTPLQRLLLSATVAGPARMGAWFQGSDKPFEVVHIPGRRALMVTLDHLTAPDGESFRQGQAVVDAVAPIVREHAKVLMFANSRNECDWLYWKLHDQLRVPTLLHYSTLDKKYREGVERRLQRSSRALCIATSTLELGVDIGDIDAVVMYGAPASTSSFIQRIGRGNRRSDLCQVYGLCREYHIDGSELGAEHDLIMLYALVASMLESELETRPETRLFSVHVQQLLSLAYQFDGVMEEILTRVVEAAEQEPFASADDLHAILGALVSRHFFNYDIHRREYHPAERWEQTRRSLQLWGNIATRFYDTVVDAEVQVPVSQVPRGKAQAGRVFLFAGQPRLVTDVTGTVVSTLRLAVDEASTIAYETTGAAMPPEVAQKAQQLLQTPSFPDLPVHIDGDLTALMRSYRERFRMFDFDHQVAFERVGRQYCYYTFGGTWANEVLAMYLREDGLRVTQVDGWRVFTTEPVENFRCPSADPGATAALVRDHLPQLIRRMGFSCHFYQLPDDLQHREVCSILDLPRVTMWLGCMRGKLPVQMGSTASPSSAPMLPAR